MNTSTGVVVVEQLHNLCVQSLDEAHKMPRLLGDRRILHLSFKYCRNNVFV